MHVKRIFVLYLSVVFSSTVFGQNIDSLIKSGNKLYSDGEYEEAVNTYEKVMESGYESVALYFNLGNAYFKSNKIAPALLNYERAKKLKPYDKDVNYNLELARTYVVDKVDIIPEVFYIRWYKNLVQRFSSDTWTIISAVGFFIFLVLFSVYIYSAGYLTKKTAFIAAAFMFFIWITTFAFAWSGKKLASEHNEAIVFSPSVTVKSSPDESGTELFVIHEGTKVTIIDKLNGWTEINLRSGSRGWLPGTSIEDI